MLTLSPPRCLALGSQFIAMPARYEFADPLTLISARRTLRCRRNGLSRCFAVMSPFESLLPTQSRSPIYGRCAPQADMQAAAPMSAIGCPGYWLHIGAYATFLYPSVSSNMKAIFKPIWLGDKRRKALIFRHAGCERPALLDQSGGYENAHVK